MNSFSTSDDTKEFLSKSHGDLLKERNLELLQNKSPKIDAKSLEPVSFPEDPDLEWYGHLCSQLAQASADAEVYECNLGQHRLALCLWPNLAAEES